jgi:hypothetical protein
VQEITRAFFFIDFWLKAVFQNFPAISKILSNFRLLLFGELLTRPKYQLSRS